MKKDTAIFTGQFLRFRQIGSWEYVERVNAQGAAVIIAVTHDNKLVLVEQPRPPVQAHVIELPAGLIGDIPGAEDESAMLAARRELEEETGYRAGHIEPLVGGPPSPGLSNETMMLFFATQLEKIHDGGGVDGEDITTHTIGLNELPKWLAEKQKQGVMVDPKVYAGLYFAQTKSH